MTSREVPLSQGEVRWLFPTLTDAAEQERIRQVLQTADDAVYWLGQRLGARPDMQIRGVPLNRFVYQRLGPEPDFPVTVLMAEGGSDQIWTFVLLRPTGSGPYSRPGPPWCVDTAISLICDSDPEGCAGHEIDARMGQPVGTPMEAAAEVQAASEWLLERLENETKESLRARDKERGHAPTPRGVD